MFLFPIVEKLKESHRHKEAGQVLVEHLNDPEEAFVAFVEGQLWTEAVQLMHSHNRLDLYETNLKPALLEASEDMLMNLDKKMETFNNYLTRLKDVVTMKEKLAEGNLEETDINIEDVDMYSDITSVHGGQSVTSRTKSNPGSLKTRASNRTKSSRNRRKQENKKYSTKEGSKYEDLGIMVALHDLISQTYKSLFNEVSSLLRVLVKYGFKDIAKKLQDKTMKLDAEMKEKESVIWNPKWMDNLNEDQNVKFGPDATTEDILNRANQESVYKPEFSMLEPKFRFPPQRVPNNDWMLQILM